MIKTRWLSTFIDDLLAQKPFVIDAAIIPVRDLGEAAMSRVVIERQAIARGAPFLAETGMSWPIWAGAPGGVLYSLLPLDQARVLAQEFHHLVQRLVVAGVSTLFLDFPRFAEDGDYFFAMLCELLPPDTQLDAARVAHARLVGPPSCAPPRPRRRPKPPR